jgi:tetratricopeptide (TPR) repeat protein
LLDLVVQKACFIIFFCFTFLFSQLVAQPTTVDSLKSALQNSNHDTTALKIIGQLSVMAPDGEWEKYSILMKDRAEAAFKNLEKNNSKPDSVLRKFYLAYFSGALNNIGLIYYNKGEVYKALKYYYKCLEIQHKEIKDKGAIANTETHIGSVYLGLGDISKALEFFNRSLKVQQEIGEKAGIANSLSHLAIIYRNQGDISKATEYYHESLKIYEELGDKSGIATSLLNIGFVYLKQGDMKKGSDYLNKSLKIQEEIGDMNGMALTLNNIGSIYRNQGNIEKALEYFKQGQAISGKTNNKRGITYSLNNLAAIYSDQGKLNESLQNYYESLEILKETEDKHALSHTSTCIGRVFLKQNDLPKAESYGSQGLDLSRKLGYPELIRNASELLFNVYKKQNKNKEALEMHELFTKMSDSISNEESRKAGIQAQFKYEYEKKAIADSIKTAEEKKVTDAQLKQEKTTRYALYGGLLLVGLFAIFMVNRFRVIRSQKKLIEIQKHVVDEKQKEVMDSIHYAKRIQSTLLPAEKYFQKNMERLKVNGKSSDELKP